VLRLRSALQRRLHLYGMINRKWILTLVLSVALGALGGRSVDAFPASPQDACKDAKQAIQCLAHSVDVDPKTGKKTPVPGCEFCAYEADGSLGGCDARETIFENQYCYPCSCSCAEGAGTIQGPVNAADPEGAQECYCEGPLVVDWTVCPPPDTPISIGCVELPEITVPCGDRACCGNGKVEAGEDCDDGNIKPAGPGDNCPADCKYQQYKLECYYELKDCCDEHNNDVTGHITFKWVPDKANAKEVMDQQGFIEWKATLEGIVKTGKIFIAGAMLTARGAPPALGIAPVDVTFENCNAKCNERCVDAFCVERLDEEFKCELTYVLAGGKDTKDIYKNPGNTSVTCVHPSVKGEVLDIATGTVEEDCITECLLSCPPGDKGSGNFDKDQCTMAGITECTNFDGEQLPIDCITGMAMDGTASDCKREFLCSFCAEGEFDECPEELGSADDCA